MSAEIIAFASASRPARKAAPNLAADPAADPADRHVVAARDARHRAFIDFAAEIAPLLECAWHALSTDNLTTACACLDELQETFPPDGAGVEALLWRDRQIDGLADIIILHEAARAAAAPIQG